MLSIIVVMYLMDLSMIGFSPYRVAYVRAGELPHKETQRNGMRAHKLLLPAVCLRDGC